MNATTGRLPNLLLAGVPKAGTTALFSYLTQHPDVCGTDPKEVDHFTPRRVGAPLAPVEEYARHVAHCPADVRWIVDGSPSYLTGGAPVAAAVRETLGAPRVVVVLRDPVRRLWSAYHFGRARGGLEDVASFEAFVALAREARAAGTDRSLGNRLFGYTAGFYAEHLEPWLETFGDDVRVLFAEHLAEDPEGEVRGLFAWLGLPTELPGGLDVSPRNRTVAVRSRTLAAAAGTVRDRLDGVRDRVPALDRGLRRLYRSLNHGQVDQTMDPRTRQELEAEYAAANVRLARLLAARGQERFPAWLSSAVEEASA